MSYANTTFTTQAQLSLYLYEFGKTQEQKQDVSHYPCPNCPHRNHRSRQNIPNCTSRIPHTPLQGTKCTSGYNEDAKWPYGP